jgi:hypothetical protein
MLLASRPRDRHHRSFYMVNLISFLDLAAHEAKVASRSSGAAGKSIA